MKPLIEFRIAMVFQFLLGFLFLYSGIQKISNPDDFLLIIENYHLLPPTAENIVTYLLPWLEFAVGSMFVLGIYVRPAAIILISMLLTFSLIIAVNVIRGISFSCGCFSLSLDKGGKMSAFWWIGRDIVLAIVAAFVYKIDISRNKPISTEEVTCQNVKA